MNHADHVRLLAPGIIKNSGGIWADIGSGDGAFTLALRELIGPSGQMYSVDQDISRLQKQKNAFTSMFPDTNITYLHADFTTELPLPPLDGLIAANSIHFTPNTLLTFTHLTKFLKNNGSFIIVEYNTNQGNRWVPYAFSFSSYQTICAQIGLKNPQLLATIPSSFLHEIYSAKATKT